MTGSQFIASLEANFDDALSSKRTPATSTTLGHEHRNEDQALLDGGDERGGLRGRHGQDDCRRQRTRSTAQATKQTPSITARIAGFLKKLSPLLPLRPARSCDFARISAMA